MTADAGVCRSALLLFVAAAGLAGGLTGCATRVPRALTPELVPTAFVGESPQSETVWPSTAWWAGFGSEELSSLIAAAEVNNRDLSASAARVMEAQAQTMISRSNLFPQLNLQAQTQRAGGSSGGFVGGQPTSGSGNSSSSGNSFVASVGATYELDIWGLARANLRSAKELLKSARFAQQSLAISITAGVANGYFNVLGLRERLAIANEDIAAIGGILDIVKLKVSNGTTSHLELAQETAQLESVQAELPVLQEQELEARVALALLVGRAPEGFEVTAQNSERVALPAVAPGLPSDLLVRRPDVAQAEATLASAHANLDAARAALLPQLSLTGDAGFSSAALSELFHTPSFVWEAGANLLQTIFAGGKLVGQKRLAYATQTELVAGYQQAVLSAFGDVESALGQVKNTAVTEAHLRKEVDAAREAFQISELQYKEGTTDLLGVLQAQQTLFGARDQLAQTRAARLQAIVHLYEALGGGWVEDPRERTQVMSAAPAVKRPRQVGD